MNVALLGLRGCGKSTVGRLLADRLGWSFIDTDGVIVQRSGRSIRELFQSPGVPAFRKLESEVVTAALAADRAVIALGGGALDCRETADALRDRARCIWLRADPKILWDRIRNDPASADNRPDLSPRGGLAEVVDTLARRTPVYARSADWTIDTDILAAADVAVHIERWLRERGDA